MYRNILGEKVSKTRYREMLAAAKNRRELITAGLGRRDLLKMGLLTAAGTLLPNPGIERSKVAGLELNMCSFHGTGEPAHYPLC